MNAGDYLVVGLVLLVLVILAVWLWAAHRRDTKGDDWRYPWGMGPTSDYSRVVWNKTGGTWLHYVGRINGREIWDNLEKHTTRERIIEAQRCGRWLGADPDKAESHPDSEY